MKKRMIIIGGGGHAKVVMDAVKLSGEYAIYGIVDPKLSEGASILGIKVLGRDDKLEGLFDMGVEYAFIGIGSIGDCGLRKSLYYKLKAIGFRLPVIIHPKAVIADDAKFGEGTFVAAGAIVNPGAKIGKNVIINTSSSIDHDCVIGDFVHVAPGVIMSGGVRVGDETHIGTGARITQYLTIGGKCLIGAGQTIRHGMADNQKSFVRPIKQMRRDRRVFIIAEAGVNHNGNIGTAKRIVDAAAIAGADAVKFQTFRADALSTVGAPCADYQKGYSAALSSQHAMLKRLELDKACHIKLIDHCKRRSIEFISSPFDMGSIDMLNTLGLKFIKIPSGEITNYPYLEKIGRLKKKLIISTGMSNINEVKCAVGVLINAGTAKMDITVMQCTTAYPAAFGQVNLNAIATMRDELGLGVGYSDHTPGIEAAIAAVALGSSVIEKHLTLDKRMNGPDHKASLEPSEFALMVKSIRNVENAMGNGMKKVLFSEIRNKTVVRKSIVASRDVKKGDCFTEENITTKRPGTGLSPMQWRKVLGRRAKRFFKKDTLIKI